MKRIGVTQRREHITDRNEVWDSLDVRLSKLIWGLGFLPVPLASGITDLGIYLDRLELGGFILSGGNDIGQMLERDMLETYILKRSSANRLPVLGICRGMQMINIYQGGVVYRIDNHVSVRHKVFGKFVGTGGRDVNSFHRYGILESGLGEGLEASAWSEDGSVEALHHRDLPWLGVMWHPERESTISDSDKFLIRELFQNK